MQVKIPQRVKRWEDFDVELMGKRVSVKLADGEWITGTLERSTRFWLKLNLRGKTVYVNKSHIIEIELDGGARG